MAFSFGGAAEGAATALRQQQQDQLKQQESAASLQNQLARAEYERQLTKQAQDKLAFDQQTQQGKQAALGELAQAVNDPIKSAAIKAGVLTGAAVLPQTDQVKKGPPVWVMRNGAPVDLTGMAQQGDTPFEKPSAASNDQVWVVRGDKVIPIEKGTAQAGDRPYEKPAAAGVTVQLGDQGLDMAAQMYAKTGQLPPMGMGTAGAQARAKIIERAAHFNPATNGFDATTAPDLASNKAGYSANTGAMNQLQKNYEAVSAFENTVKANGQLLDNVLSRIPGQTNYSFLNAPARAIGTATGNQDMAQFNALRQSVANEYGRIISNPTLTGVLSDSARREMETIMSPSASVGQIRAALSALQSEATNRRDSFATQLQSIKGRIGGGTPAAPAGGDDAAARAQALIDKYAH